MVGSIGETSYTFSAQGTSLFLLATGRIQKVTQDSNGTIQTSQRGFLQRAWKQSESLVLRVVPDEEFLHVKIKSKDVHVDYGATEDIPEDVCSFRR